MAYFDRVEIVRTQSYDAACRRLTKLGASETDIRTMEDEISGNPIVGSLIPGSGGLRKVRFGFAKKGKSGGGRTIYYAVTHDAVVYLIFAYAKSDQKDLAVDQKRMFRTLIKELTDDG